MKEINKIRVRQLEALIPQVIKAMATQDMREVSIGSRENYVANLTKEYEKLTGHPYHQPVREEQEGWV